MKNNKITSRDVDFAKWYTDIVLQAHLARYSSVKGFIVIEPYGYAIWENMQKILDAKFKELGHANLYMPLLIPESLLNKEAEHVEGFAPEVAWVTTSGAKQLEERFCIRPTSETLFCEYYRDIVKSYRDLPKLCNQWCNIVRWEKETRPFLRSREFLWQEGHTIHATQEEAEAETMGMLGVYKDFYENYLAIPVLTGRKTEKEKFAGAEYTLTIEALMANGISLQGGTSHYFGQKFSRPFDIKFLNQNNEYEYVYQTSWGVTTRMIGALIMVHSDDNGLILPPKIAPKQIVIIPIGDNNDVKEEAFKINTLLTDHQIRSFVDNSDNTPGFKFAEHEMNGIPLRIEIGAKELANQEIMVVRRDNNAKINLAIDEQLPKNLDKLLKMMQNNMFETAKKRNDEKTYAVTNIEEFKKIMETKPGYIKAMWCGDEACEVKLKEIKGTKSRCIADNNEHLSDKCICCGKPAQHMVYWGIQY
jgi:prolyl-tRNA synthetase